MAKSNTTSAIEPTESPLIGISHLIHDLAAQLAGIESITRIMCDHTGCDVDLGNSLNLVGATSQYINNELCLIADQVRRIGEEGGVA